jgi:hypothetical protein
MAMIEQLPVPCGEYFLYPLALYVPGMAKWQALVILTRNKEYAATAGPSSKCFPNNPVTFDDEASAKNYALRFGEMLVRGEFEGLPT